VIKAMSKIQGQTTSGTNTLIPRAMIDFDLSFLANFYDPVTD